MKREPADRRTEYSVLKDDFFVISGLQNLKKFYVRAQARGEEVRGVTVLYDQAMAGIMEPVVVAMSSALRVPRPPVARRRAAGRVCERRRRRAGQIVTSREALEGCYVVTSPARRRIGRRRQGEAGLVLLRVHGASSKPARSGAAPKGRRDRCSASPSRRRRAAARGGAARARVSDALALERPGARRLRRLERDAGSRSAPAEGRPARHRGC
jgi:hypothetical protein